ncbi:hypothetical protein EON80_26405, partial [bacterium]
ELLNRIGQNIVVFDFVREATLRKIVENKVLPSIAAQVEERWKVRVNFAPAVVDGLMVLGGSDVANGGRGIGNVAETVVLNPLARILFRLFESGGGRIEATSLTVAALRTSTQSDGARHELQWRLDQGAMESSS